MKTKTKLIIANSIGNMISSTLSSIVAGLTANIVMKAFDDISTEAVIVSSVAGVTTGTATYVGCSVAQNKALEKMGLITESEVV